MTLQEYLAAKESLRGNLVQAISAALEQLGPDAKGISWFCANSDEHRSQHRQAA